MGRRGMGDGGGLFTPNTDKEVFQKEGGSQERDRERERERERERKKRGERGTDIERDEDREIH